MYETFTVFLQKHVAREEDLEELFMDVVRRNGRD